MPKKVTESDVVVEVCAVEDKVNLSFELSSGRLSIQVSPEAARSIANDMRDVADKIDWGSV